jgi:hypothetical protein
VTSTRTRVLARFDRWAPPAFALGGLGLLGTTIVGSIDVAGVAQAPPRLAMGPLLFGLWFVFVGLIGAYQHFQAAAPRLSRAGVAAAGLAWLLWTVTLIAAVTVDLTTTRTFAEPGNWGPPVLTVGFVLALLSFLAYGVAGTRTGHPSRGLGVLFLVPVFAFLGQAVLLLSKILTGDVVAVLQLALGGITGLVLIILAYRLRPSGDVTRTRAGTDIPS